MSNDNEEYDILSVKVLRQIIRTSIKISANLCLLLVKVKSPKKYTEYVNDRRK